MPQVPDATLDAAGCPIGTPAALPFSFKPVLTAAAAATDPALVAAAMAQLAVAVMSVNSGQPSDGSSVGRIIGDAAAKLITGAERAGVLIPVADSPSNDPVDAADAALRLLMKVQDSADEGPLLDVVRGGEQVLVHDLRTDFRWPRFTARSPWQIRSLLSTAIPMPDNTTGVLTVVSSRSWAFDDTDARLAAVVAVHAALALAHLAQVRHLQTMAESRDVIGQAKGMVMQRYRLTAEQAFSVLTQASQQRNMKLRTLCRQLTESGDLPVEPPP